MSKQDKFFTKVKLYEEESKITAIEISEKMLVIGYENGILSCYEIKDGNKLLKTNQQNLKNKIDKIIIPQNIKIAFILTGGEIYIADIPTLGNFKPLIKAKDFCDIYINKEDPQYDNVLLTINKKRKIKLYDFDYSNRTLNEKKMNTVSVVEMPKCGSWIDNNYFIYSNGTTKIFWLNIITGESVDNDFDNCVQLINIDGRVAVSSSEMTLFMKGGKVESFNPILHQGIEFRGYSDFKNHMIALYKNSVHIFTKSEQSYNLAETIDFTPAEGSGMFLVTSNYKVIVISESGTKCNIFDFQEKPIEAQIKVLIDQRLYNNGLEKLIENVPEDDPTKPEKIENLFLDCAWASIEDKKKDYKNSLKYIRLTNFNPFEFIYMFTDSLKINIIHSDKKQEIIDHLKGNQLPEENEAFSFLIKILTIKRDYLLAKYKSAEYESQKVTFMSSKRSKINLSDSNTEITVKIALDFINSSIIKSLIKLNGDPHEIESVLDNKSINYSFFNEFEEDPFFKDEKNKDLDQTKFTLAYTSEKKGDFESALKVWENFGNSKTKDDKFSIIARERTKKIFLKFKDSKNIDEAQKGNLFKNYIKWILIKFPNDAFEIYTKSKLVSSKEFFEKIIPEVESDSNNNLEEKFLEYCNENQPSAEYQTQLLQIYIKKIFSLKPKSSMPEKIEGDLKNYYDTFVKIILDPKSCYDKRIILDSIVGSWLKEPIKYLYSQLKEHNKALNELFGDAKTTLSFSELEKYCKENISTRPEIYQDFYEILSNYVKKDCQSIIDNNLKEIEKINKLNESEKAKYSERVNELKDEIKRMEDLKKPYEQEMLKILKNYKNWKNIDPLIALNYANENWNVLENNDFFNYLSNVVRDYIIEGKKYKIAKNISGIGAVYKQKENYELQKKYVTIDQEKTCDLCKKKIGNTLFLVYPNLRVYHAKCAPDQSIDPTTGVDYRKKRYFEKK
jgi:hypothetical protein